jgi:hypothetical protein
LSGRKRKQKQQQKKTKQAIRREEDESAAMDGGEEVLNRSKCRMKRLWMLWRRSQRKKYLREKNNNHQIRVPYK